MPARQKYSDEDLLNKAREFYKKKNRPPRQTDFPAGLAYTIYKRVGAWEVYIQKALGKKAGWHRWTNEELLTIARKFFDEHRRFPTGDDVRAIGLSIPALVLRRFKNFNLWLELAVGTSPRIEILRAINLLTPPPIAGQAGCEEASSQEILAHIRKRMPFATNLLAYNVRTLKTDGYILGGRYDKTSWWKMTLAGKQFLKEKSDGRSGDDLLRQRA